MGVRGIFCRLYFGYTLVRFFVCPFVVCVCVYPFFLGGVPPFFLPRASRARVPFLPAVSSRASGFLPAGRPRGFRFGSSSRRGSASFSCGVSLWLLLSLLFFLLSLLLVRLLPFLLLLLLLLFGLRCRCLRCFACLGVVLLFSNGSVGRRPPLLFLFGWWGRLLLWSVALARPPLLLCLPWLPSFVALFGLASLAVLVFVVLGVGGGSVPLRLSKLSSSAWLPLGVGLWWSAFAPLSLERRLL